MKAEKPEGRLPSHLFYSREESIRYTTNSNNIKVQRLLAERCVELLETNIINTSPSELLLLDIGCGSGLSGQVLSEHGYNWIGLDISKDMLTLANEICTDQSSSTPNLVCLDIGKYTGLRESIFDGVISTSVIQWLCHSYATDEDPVKRLHVFFRWLYNCLNKSARAVLQFYPSNEQQTNLIAKSAVKVGFNTYFVVDNPESASKKKLYLILTIVIPTVKDSIIAQAIKDTTKVHKQSKNNSRKARVLKAKQRHIQKGLSVSHDSKYTGRKRKDKF